MGGFGLRSMTLIATPAWVASMAQVVQYTMKLADAKRLSDFTTGELEGALFSLALNDDMEVLPATAREFWLHFGIEPAGAGFQKLLTKALLSEAKKCLMQATDKVDKARLVAATADAAGAWLTLVPTHRLLRMRDEYFTHAARLRLGLHPFDDTRACTCGKSTRTDPTHFMACTPNLLRAMTMRHNKILFNLSQLAGMMLIPAKIEPKVDYMDTKRADGLFFFQEKEVVIDVSVTHPLAKSYVAAASKVLGAAAKREREKNLEYAKRYEDQGTFFLPFVVETLGGIGPSARKFIKNMAYDAGLTGGDAVVDGNTETFITRVVAVALQVGNAMVSMDGRKKYRTLNARPL